MKTPCRILLLCLCCLLCFQTVALAHGGSTDENGGHYDRSTGEYHYHHGYPAHLHTNGVCPYNFDDKTGQNSGGSGNGSSKESNHTYSLVEYLILAYIGISILGTVLYFVVLIFSTTIYGHYSLPVIIYSNLCSWWVGISIFLLLSSVINSIAFGVNHIFFYILSLFLTCWITAISAGSAKEIGINNSSLNIGILATAITILLINTVGTAIYFYINGFNLYLLLHSIINCIAAVVTIIEAIKRNF